MYKLSSRTGPAVFQSIGSNSDDADDFAYESFTPTSPLTFNTIDTLKTDYSWVLGDCHGGSLRWQVRTDPTHALFIYYGSAPQFGNGSGGCNPATGGVNQSGTNMINLSGLRYDTSQYVPGTQYNTYAGHRPSWGTFPLHASRS